MDSQLDVNSYLGAITKEQFAYLKGRPITLGEASEKYGLTRDVISVWARKYPHVVITLERDYRLILEEAGVAYLAAIHRVREQFGSSSGIPLVDENGRPNLIKHPRLSAYRRRRRHQHG